MTECTQSSFDLKAHYSREIVARFDGGTISSDGGRCCCGKPKNG